MMRSQSKSVCLCAVLSATGLMVSYVESFVVLPYGIPGIRIGLANIATLIALYLLGGFYAFIVTVIRVMLSALLFGSFSSFLYSIAGACLALLAMTVFKRLGFSIYSVSVAGAVMHNTAQIAVAAVLMSGVYLLWYLPVLIFTGVMFGLLTGFLADILVKRLSKVLFSTGEGG